MSCIILQVLIVHLRNQISVYYVKCDMDCMCGGVSPGKLWASLNQVPFHPCPGLQYFVSFTMYHCQSEHWTMCLYACLTPFKRLSSIWWVHESKQWKSEKAVDQAKAFLEKTGVTGLLLLTFCEKLYQICSKVKLSLSVSVSCILSFLFVWFVGWLTGCMWGKMLY